MTRHAESISEIKIAHTECNSGIRHDINAGSEMTSQSNGLD